MDVRYQVRWSVLWLLILLSLGSCKRMFEYSLHDAELPDQYKQRLNERNLDTLRAWQIQAPFQIAVLSDSHYFLDELHDAVDRINQDPQVLFTVVTGDLSDQGLNREYLYFYDQITRLKQPFLVVIGNHDYLSNAENIYDEMFGAGRNYTLDLAHYRFIFFDNIFWEKDGRPDFDWLEQQLANRPAERIPILFSHIPPFGDQYDSTAQARHLQLIRNYRVQLSVHGHLHTYSQGRFRNGSQFVVVPTVGKRQYCTIFFNSSDLSPDIKLVNF